MTQTLNGLSASSQGLFASADRIRIAQLALGQPTEPEASSHIEAVVSLLWPYSSKNRELSLLLAEPDVRLRSAKGQLRVTFHGTGAHQVATSQLGIGDSVLLRIDNAEWKETGDAVETPGKKVQWDLHFKNRIILQAMRSGSHLATIDYEGSDTPPPSLDATPHQLATSYQINGFHDSTSNAFLTPASGRSKRISSGSFIDASLDPFADDDGFVLGKGRKRTKFGRTSGSWRLLGEGETSGHEENLEATPQDAIAQMSEQYLPQSPARSNGLQDLVMLDQNSYLEESPVETSMPPPLTPFRLPSERAREAPPQIERLVSPRLHPLASPGLPMVSPLVKTAGGSAGYFDVQSPALSELDATSILSTNPQEGMIAKNPATDGSVDICLPDYHERSPESPKQIPPRTQPIAGSKVVEPLSLIQSRDESEVQPSAFGSPAAASPFGFAPGGFSGSSGFNSEPKSAFSTAEFGTSIAQSPFAIPSVSSGIPANFPTFGNYSTFGRSRENGTGVGSDFATPGTEIRAKSFVEPYDLGVFQEEPGDDLQKQPLQEMEAAMDEQRAKKSVFQIDVETPRHERELSEDDDDMYGSARPMARTPSLRSVTSGRFESKSRNREELLDVTMLDAGMVPPSALPSSKAWNNTTQTHRHRLRQSPFLDGASDEMSESEASGHDTAPKVSSEGASTPFSSESLELFQSIEARNLDIIDLVTSTSVEDTVTFESLTRAQIALGPILELDGRPILQTQAEERATVLIIDNGDKVDDLTAAEPEHELEETEAKQIIGQRHMSDPQIDDDVSGPDGDEANTRPEQLLTPDNTQQDFLERHSFKPLEQVLSLQLPPSPDNTQESAYADLSRLDGPSETQPLEQINASAEVSLPAQAQSQNVKSRSSQKPPNVPALSSPYFTPRRSARLSPERQTEDIESRETDDGFGQEEAMEQLEPDLPARKLDQTAAPSPRHNKRLHNMLGMATPLSYFTPLPILDEHYSQQIDILAMCTADSGVPTRSKAGMKDYHVTLHLADSFLDGAAAITAQLFRPYKSALPFVQRGEVVLLRSIKVQSQKRRMVLLSTDSSAWVVFSLSNVSPKDAEYWDLQVDVAGPPVEYGSEEYVYAKRLMEWWETDGRLVHKVMSTRDGDPLTRPRTRDGPDKTNMTGDGLQHVTKGTTNGFMDAYNSQPIDPPRTTRSSRRTHNRTDSMENDKQTREKSAPLSPTFGPTSPTPARTTRSSRRVTNRTDNTDNEGEPATADISMPLPETTSPKTGRRARRSASISDTPEVPRSLRSQSTVHELRDGTKYVDGHVPTKKDGVHVLRDGTKYVDENISPAGKTPSVRGESVVHEVRDGTNYVDGGKSPEVRRSARNKRGGSLVHELRDGAKYTDG